MRGGRKKIAGGVAIGIGTEGRSANLRIGIEIGIRAGGIAEERGKDLVVIDPTPLLDLGAEVVVFPGALVRVLLSGAGGMVKELEELHVSV
jgi:hypothetical protein